MIASKAVRTKAGASRGHAPERRSPSCVRPKLTKTNAAATKASPTTPQRLTSGKSLGAPKAAARAGTTAQVAELSDATLQVKLGVPVKPLSRHSTKTPTPQAPRFTVSCGGVKESEKSTEEATVPAPAPLTVVQFETTLDTSMEPK